MERKELSRHLAAILFTDIVGYTSMMQRNEMLALASVRKHHEALEELVPLHVGEIYQYYGDGSLSIFSSAKQAVQCAFEIQKRMLADPAVMVRTGIHIGEIYTENGKIFGDGVNVASRIESMGQGGTVLFSRDVFEKIRNLDIFQIKSLGTFEFKNVDDPVAVYALTNPEIATPDGSFSDGKLKVQKKKSALLIRGAFIAFVLISLLSAGFLLKQKSGVSGNEAWETEKSVAVLPFKNYTDGDEVDFLSTGIAEDILIQLAQIKDLKVISPTSSMKFKDSGKDLMAIAKDLDVTSLLDGSVQRHENNLRISVQLIKASDESIIWAESFDREFKDVLNVQRDVALAVSNKLKVSLTPAIKNRLEDKVNVDPEAYVNYQKGQELLKRSSGTKEDMERARVFFQKAIQKDSTYARAWVGLADSWIETIFWHRVTDDDALPQAKAAVMHALRIDPENGEAYGALGAINLLERDVISSEKNLQKSLELNPNYSYAYERLAWIAVMRGQEKESFDLYEKVLLLDPLSTRLKGSQGTIYYFIGQYKTGIEKCKEFLSLHPGDNFILWALAYCYAGNGEYEKAIETLHQRTLGTKTNWIFAYCYSKLGRTEEARQILDYHLERKQTSHVPDFMMSVIYASLGNLESALDHIEKSVEAAGENWFVLGFESDPMLDPIRSHPRFKNVLDQVGEEYRK